MYIVYGQALVHELMLSYLSMSALYTVAGAGAVVTIFFLLMCSSLACGLGVYNYTCIYMYMLVVLCVSMNIFS